MNPNETLPPCPYCLADQHSECCCLVAAWKQSNERADKAEAEVARLESINLAQSTIIAGAKQEMGSLKAEVERLQKRPFGCKCVTLREKALGDGCDECNKALVIEMLEDHIKELEANLRRAVEIAEEFKIAFKEENHFRKGCDCGLCELAEELDAIKETLPETK
jgi:predicted RNase H-like nuclease (RuvC/YqgF family)